MEVTPVVVPGGHERRGNSARRGADVRKANGSAHRRGFIQPPGNGVALRRGGAVDRSRGRGGPQLIKRIGGCCVTSTRLCSRYNGVYQYDGTLPRAPQPDGVVLGRPGSVSADRGHTI